MATPFNDVETLCTFCAFRPGLGGANDFHDALRESVTKGEFSHGQLQLVLNEAREEIYCRAGQKENDEYETARAYQLTRAELYLASAMLYERFGEKTFLKYQEANMGNVSAIGWGADTPSPAQKHEYWLQFARRYREIAERLLTGQGSAWEIGIGTLADSPRFPCLSTGIFQQYCNGCCMECIE